MKLDSSIASPLVPDPRQHSVLELGLKPCTTEQWISVDEDLTTFYQHKQEQFRQHKEEVYAALPESQSAQEEFHDVLLQDLLTQHRNRYSLAKNV